METLHPTRAGSVAEAPINSGETAADRSRTRSAQPVTLRIAYLLSQYPAVSHTFFLHEVLGLRARGLHIETASINRPDRRDHELPQVEAEEARSTFYVKDGRTLQACFKVLTTAVRHPGALLRGLSVVRCVPDLALRRRLFWLLYLAEAMLVGRWMRERRLTQLHVHFAGPVATVGMLASAAWRVPWSLTIHGPEELLDTSAYHLREKVSSARFVFCISDFCRSQLLQLTPPSMWHKFHVVRLGVDPVMLTPHSRPAGSAHSVIGKVPSIAAAGAQRRLELVSIGRLVPAKGHRILLEALSLLHKRGVSLHLTLIGGGTELAALKDFVACNDLEHMVSFTGALAHEQALSHLRRADIFALASFAEGIPVALMEAMSLGLPCVSTSVAGIPELIRTGHDGILVPPANAAAFADALEALASDVAQRRDLGASARQRIIRSYNLPLNQELLAASFEAQVSSFSEAGPHSQPRLSR